MSEMKRGLQWNTLIPSAGPTSCRNLHCSVVCALKLLGTRRSGAKFLQAQILTGSSLLCNWLHFPQETGIHVENKASHREILCAVYLMSGQARFNASQTATAVATPMVKPAIRSTAVRVSIFCSYCSCATDFVTSSDMVCSPSQKKFSKPDRPSICPGRSR